MRVEEYRYGPTRFQKHYADDGSVRFWQDGRELSLAEWNRAVNQLQPQDLKADNPNPLIRFLEAHRRRSFLRFARAGAGQTVGDVGCETGFMAALLAPHVAKVVCVDIDPAMLELARQRIHSANVEYVVGDICALDLPDGAFELTLASEVLEHVPQIETALAELARVTRTGGFLVVSLPNGRLILRLKALLRALGLTRLLGALRPDLAIGHVRVYTRAEVESLLKGVAGLNVERVIYSRPFALNIYGRARKT